MAVAVTLAVEAAAEVLVVAVVGRAAARAGGLVEAVVAAIGSNPGSGGRFGARRRLSPNSSPPKSWNFRLILPPSDSRCKFGEPISRGTLFVTRQEVPLERTAWSRSPA